MLYGVVLSSTQNRRSEVPINDLPRSKEEAQSFEGPERILSTYRVQEPVILLTIVGLENKSYPTFSVLCICHACPHFYKS